MTNNPLMLRNWKVLHEPKIERDGSRVFSAEYEVKPDSCPECGAIERLYRHGTKTVTYRDIPAFGAKSVIEAKVIRYKCRECSATFMQPIPDVDARRRMTTRLIKYVGEQGIYKTFSEVARDVGLDEKTIRNICDDYMGSVIRNHEIYAPTILGIDEMKLGERKRTIFIDVDGKALLDLIDAMNRKRVDLWLSRLPHRNRVRLVTMDMWGPYRASVKALMPHARIVTDKWHVVSKANDALDRVRARHRRIIGDHRNPHKGRLLLQTHGKNLSPMRRMALEGVLLNTPLINDGWTCKEGFYAIWEATNRADAEARYDAWKASIPASVKPEFGKLATTVDNWREEIFTFFDLPFTNAYTEARNRLVKDMQREGRGYSFDKLRAKALLSKRLTGEPMVLCQNCLAVFPKQEYINPKHIIPWSGSAMTNIRNSITLCYECHSRFHILEEDVHDPTSTSKSE